MGGEGGGERVRGSMRRKGGKRFNRRRKRGKCLEPKGKKTPRGAQQKKSQMRGKERFKNYEEKVRTRKIGCPLLRKKKRLKRKRGVEIACPQACCTGGGWLRIKHAGAKFFGTREREPSAPQRGRKEGVVKASQPGGCISRGCRERECPEDL